MSKFLSFGPVDTDADVINLDRIMKAYIIYSRDIRLTLVDGSKIDLHYLYENDAKAVFKKLLKIMKVVQL